MGDKYGADFIGFQEVLKHQVTELQEMLPQYSWVGVGRDDGDDRGRVFTYFIQGRPVQFYAHKYVLAVGITILSGKQVVICSSHPGGNLE